LGRSEADAVQSFRDLLKCMGDRPAPATERENAGEAIIRLVRSDQDIKDEVFLQILKQLIDNPSTRSVGYGWQLLVTICKSVSPSDQLYEYFMAFLRSMQQRKETLINRSAKRCIDALLALNELPRLSGHLHKKTPSKFRMDAYDWRFVVLRNMTLFWYKKRSDANKPESAAPDGGPHCCGTVSFLGNDVTLHYHKESETKFDIIPVGAWRMGKMAEKDDQEERIMTFDAKESEIPRKLWMNAIEENLKVSRMGAKQEDEHLTGMLKGAAHQKVNVARTAH